MKVQYGIAKSINFRCPYKEREREGSLNKAGAKSVSGIIRAMPLFIVVSQSAQS